MNELNLAQKAELIKGMGSLMGYADVMRIASALWIMALRENGHEDHSAFLPSYQRWIGNGNYYKEARFVTEEIESLIREMRGKGIEA